jgi:ribonucleoside-diphosphate reductase alpha chain
MSKNHEILKYLDEVGQQVLEKRYLHRELGETNWSDVVDRVVNHVLEDKPIAGFDSIREKIRTLILETRFVPNSPTLVNAGTAINGLSACYVVPFEDSIEGIAKTKYDYMKICQKGGGCGTTLSHIRPEGMRVGGSTHSHAAGPIKFFNTICEDMQAMTQAGFREMAMMGTMDIIHPDIEKFITAKQQEGVMHNTNISVVVDDNFMELAQEGGEWTTVFSIHDGLGDNTFMRTFDASDLLYRIAENAWANGEPGLIFHNQVKRSPYTETGQQIFATNPCGEQPLPPYGTCNLGSIDVSKFVGSYGAFDWYGLDDCIALAVVFLDSVIDKADWPIPEIEQWVKLNRPIGLGVMGFADALLKMEIAYGSEESLEFANHLGQCFYETAMHTSEKLGEVRGVPGACQYLEKPRRNVTVLSIAPTGSIALLAGCSHSIEPIYAPTTLREDKTGSYVITHPQAEHEYFRSAVGTDPSSIVSWKQHIDMQAVWQGWVDSGVSKTINMPNTATVDDVRSALIYAWESGCKGVTVYRDGSRETQVLSQEKFDQAKLPVMAKRERVLPSHTVRIDQGDERHYVTVSYDNDSPREVFVNGQSILLPDVQMRDGFSRLSSLALRYGVPVEELVKELRQIPAQGLKSVPVTIAKALEELYIEEYCPECGSSDYVNGGGCKYCASCGYERCA